jgi:hypothetical protein
MADLTWLTGDDFTMFGRGGCWALAQAIHDLTGWPMLALKRAGGLPGGHAFIVTPGGLYLDIHGPARPDSPHWEMWTRRETVIPLASTEDWTLPNWFNFRRWDRHACLARAREIAPRLAALADAQD